MTMSRRERLIMVFAVSAVALLVLDKYVLTTVIAGYSQTRQKLEYLRGQLQQSQSVIERKSILFKKQGQNKECQTAGNYAQAESNVLKYIMDSSAKNKLEVSSLQPEQAAARGDIVEVEFNMSGSGSIGSITGFMWDVETSSLPLKVKTLQLGSGSESGGQMSLQVKLSSAYVSAGSRKSTGGNKTAGNKKEDGK